MKLDPKYLSIYYEDVDEFPDYQIDPKKTILLIVDLQNEFCLKDFGEAKEFKETGLWDKFAPYFDRLENKVIPNAKKLLDFFRNHDLPVSFGRIACLREDGADRSPVQKTDGWNGMLMPIDSFAAQMVEPLTPIKDEIVVNKTTDSVTTGTNYLHLLRNMGITTVVVCGIVTDQCIASTVRGLADDGFQVITVEDACTTADQELHEAELKIMNAIYTYVQSTDQTIKLISDVL
ncbi:cysteine hydrolase family protein [Ignavigranum ruoffiae]|uniref:cysteine hydrolase family protein n=1 Tax=Ignavigranum ruoffiae TaxID=89093 RepID=UPI0024ACE39A|nr:isochorismatase family cysteine hydrolase [Ignavigranum ruoffiae]